MVPTAPHSVSCFVAEASSQDPRVFEEEATALGAEDHCVSSGQELCVAEAVHRQQTSLILERSQLD